MIMPFVFADRYDPKEVFTYLGYLLEPWELFFRASKKCTFLKYIEANPKKAAEGTIRKKYGISIDKNSVHGSDSVENAKIEIDFFFKD